MVPGTPKKLVLLLFCSIPVILAGVFLLRSPVLIITDSSFNQLYGTSRLKLKGIKTSLEMFRRVIPVPVAETAGPGVIAIAVEGASRSPRAALFPYRYTEGARAYKNNHPDVPVLVMGGRNPYPPGETAFGYVRTDTAQDLYRAGLCAAVLSGENRKVLFAGEELSGGFLEAFREGLLAQGVSREPVYLRAGEVFPQNQDIGCVVLAGPAEGFPGLNQENQSPQIPVILFSWIDPGLSPQSVKIVFDDSPWALAAEALRLFAARKGENSRTPAAPESFSGEILAGSEPLVLKDKLEKSVYRKIRGLVKEKFHKK